MQRQLLTVPAGTTTGSLIYSLIISAALLFGIATGASAEERVAVPMDALHVKNSDGTKLIHLRGLINKMRGEMNRERYELGSVTIVAKSKRNNGAAWVGIGQIESEHTRIEGAEKKFDSDDKESYQRVRLPLPTPKDTAGQWTLSLKGPLKLNRVIIGLKDCAEGECRVQKEETRRVIPLEDSEVRVPDSQKVIDIRKLVERYDGNLSLKDARLVKVEARIKVFERDGALIRLDTAGQKPARTTLSGNRNRYKKRSDDSFTLVELTPRNDDTGRGKWELVLRKGTFKIRDITVTTIDRALWRSKGAALGAAGPKENTESGNNNGKTSDKGGQCKSGNCQAGRSVNARAQGPRSCYASGDGRRIDRREGASMSFVSGCSDGKCMKKTETCYESRTCKCANGSGRCTEASSCGSGAGCRHGYVTLKFHCPSGIFDG